MERPDAVDITSEELLWVDCSVVVPNPLHPRGWDEVDESLETLAESMRLFGQRVAAVVTPLHRVKEAHLLEQGKQYRLINGHRQWFVAKSTPKHRLLIEIHKAALGQSISPVGSLVDWLERDAGKKPPTVHEIVICLSRIRGGWKQEYGEEFTESDRLLALLTGHPKSTINRFRRILDGHPDVSQAFALRLIPQGMALKVIEIDDPQEQADTVHRILAENQARSASGKRPLTVDGADEQFIRRSRRKPHLVQSPAPPEVVELAIQVAPERDPIAEIVQQVWRLIDLLMQTQAEGVTLPAKLYAYLSLFTEDEFLRYLYDCDASKDDRDIQAYLEELGMR